MQANATARHGSTNTQKCTLRYVERLLSVARSNELSKDVSTDARGATRAQANLVPL